MSGISYAHELNAGTWDRCDNLWVFGEFFADEEYCPDPPSDRKFRLLVVAALRAVWEHLIDPRSRAAVEAAEQFADTQDVSVLAAAEEDAERASREVGEPWNANNPAKCLAKLTAWKAWQALDPSLNIDPQLPPWVETITDLETDEIPGRSREQAEALHLRLFHDIFTNPFRPTPMIEPDWLMRNAGLIRTLAKNMYDRRDFSQMPLLADALERAGCTNPDILDHCRGPGPHVRGCWLTDLFLAKE